MATKEITFTFDDIEELTEELFDESGEEQSARVTYEDGTITLIKARLRDVDVQVYRVKDTPELYEAIDAEYLNVLENMTTGSDFWDRWHAVTHVLENHKIVDEVLNP